MRSMTLANSFGVGGHMKQTLTCRWADEARTGIYLLSLVNQRSHICLYKALVHALIASS